MKTFGTTVILSALMLSACDAAPESQPVVPAGPPMVVTAKELAKAYEENEAAAKLKYGDRALEVTAKIASIDLDMFDKPFLVVQGTNDFMGPQMQLTPASQAKAAGLKKGQTVTAVCAKVGEVIGTPMLEGCELK